MKRVLVFVFCLVAFGLMSQVIYQPHRRKDFRISASACSTYDTTNAWDNFIEGFQTPTTGYESNVWTGVGTTANIYPAADSSALTTYKPAGACNQALKIVLPTDGTETWDRGDLGAAIDLDTIQTDVTFDFYVESGPDANESYAIFASSLVSNIGSVNFNLRLQTTAGGLLQIKCDQGGNAITISSGQWYTAVTSLDTARAAGGSSLKLFSNGSQVGTTQTFQRNAGDFRYLYVGAFLYLEAGDNGTIWFDLISVKTN